MIFPDGSVERWDQPDITIDELLTWTLPGTIHQDMSVLLKREVNLFIVAGNKLRNQPPRKWFVSTTWTQLNFGNDRMLMTDYATHNQTVHVLGTGVFFGESRGVYDLRRAYLLMTQEIKEAWDLKDFQLSMTPAATGRDLLELCLPKGELYPTLSREFCQFLAAEFGQGRFELFPDLRLPIEIPVIGFPGLVELGPALLACIDRIDGRLMYGSCISHLPVGYPTREKFGEFQGVRTKEGKLAARVPGFYRVRVEVPPTWKHIGLLPERHGEVISYPNQPGYTFHAWVTSDELALALQEMWSISILESILWYDTDKRPDPLAIWRKRLVTLFTHAQANESNNVAQLARAGYRAITLSTLGSFNQFQTIIQRTMPRQKFLKEVAPFVKIERIKRSTSKEIEWIEGVPLSPRRQKFVHPEWTKILWGRGRARVARMALTLPYQNIVAITTDEILLADCPPDILQLIRLQDTGKPGSFRPKGRIQGPLLWPRNKAELLHVLTQENEKEGK